MSDVKIEKYEGGSIVLPKSETKKVVIPSPPSVKEMPINPRDAVIYLVNEINEEAFKTYAEDNKVVLICPDEKSADAVVAAYNYANSKLKTLNIKKGAFSVKADEANLDVANDAVEALADEDVEVDDAEVLSI